MQRTVQEKAEIAKQLEKKVWPMIDAGKIAPVIAEAFSLSDAAKAHTLMEGSAHIGKIVLMD